MIKTNIRGTAFELGVDDMHGLLVKEEASNGKNPQPGKSHEDCGCNKSAPKEAPKPKAPCNCPGKNKERTAPKPPAKPQPRSPQKRRKFPNPPGKTRPEPKTPRPPCRCPKQKEEPKAPVEDKGKPQPKLFTSDSATYEYDDCGRLQFITWDNGTTQEISYDVNGNRTSVVTTCAGGGC